MQDCANTWGTWWGRDGYFRILRGAVPESESDVELFIVGVWPRRPVRADKPNKRRTNNNNSNNNDVVDNTNDRQFRSRRQQQLSARKRERRRLLRKTLQQQRRLERYFKYNNSNSNNKRRRRLQKRKLMMGLTSPRYDYLEDSNNRQLERLKRLSRAIQSAMGRSDNI